MEKLENYFERFRKNIVGIDKSYNTPFGKKKLIYLDWIASGRLYGPVEDRIRNEFGPWVANTHTETSESGSRMTWAYHEAQKIIKKHVNAGPNDVLITAGSGMTTVVNKLMRLLGLKGCGIRNIECLKNNDRPVVFITHMEHHSNHTSWYETFADVIVLPPDEELLVDPEILDSELRKYQDRKFRIGSFTACSNVTGVFTPYYQLARIMHQHGGICFVDFAASAPYAGIDMHPADPMEKLDAIFFSPHKFLGGPGSSGVLVFDSTLYNKDVPDNPGGGTVEWTNPWGEYKYIDDIEVREDGGTPGFIQAIRIALAIRLKEQMGIEKILEREHELKTIAFKGLRSVSGVVILADQTEERLGVISFYIRDIHYNLVVKLLSDRYGIQVRGGCVCAGTYGHYLLEVSYEKSHSITEKINHGDLSEKPGWIRMSLHPTTTDQEVNTFLNAIKEIAENKDEWKKDYTYNRHKNEFMHLSGKGEGPAEVKDWFKLD